MSGGLLKYALLADGTSDRALLPIINWVLRRGRSDLEIAEPGFRARAPSAEMREEMCATLDEFGPDILFVHRDAENQDPELRRGEIPDLDHVIVRVVPVRMTEAWLLFDEAAIRRAAGNPLGSGGLGLPTLRRIEDMPDPKTCLRDALLVASEVSGRRRKRLKRDIAQSVHRVAELIADFAPLRQVSAFARFERECLQAAWTAVPRPT